MRRIDPIIIGGPVGGLMLLWLLLLCAGPGCDEGNPTGPGDEPLRRVSGRVTDGGGEAYDLRVTYIPLVIVDLKSFVRTFTASDGSFAMDVPAGRGLLGFESPTGNRCYYSNEGAVLQPEDADILDTSADLADLNLSLGRLDLTITRPDFETTQPRILLKTLDHQTVTYSANYGVSSEATATQSFRYLVPGAYQAVVYSEFEVILRRLIRTENPLASHGETADRNE